MKCVILAGGFGTRISEESYFRPKPMIEIGGKPILWHIMKEYSHFGFHEFIICCGYKQHMIKEYFSNYLLHNADVTFDMQSNEVKIHNNFSEPWKVTCIDTGLNTMTGGRIKRIAPYVGNETFMLTYGDGVCDVDIGKLFDFHKSHKKLATLTAINVSQRFGVLDIDPVSGMVNSFREKQEVDNSRINGGYMVLEPEVFSYIGGDDISFEKEPLENLTKDGQLVAFKHDGFWKCMDTKRDHEQLEAMWNSGQAPWKVWE